jgi:hypothetical protein
MPTADDSPDGVVYNATDQLGHDLKSPLTTILARARLLGRRVGASPSVGDGERGRMLADLAAIESAVREMVTVVDGIGAADGDDTSDAGSSRRRS